MKTDKKITYKDVIGVIVGICVFIIAIALLFTIVTNYFPQSWKSEGLESAISIAKNIWEIPLGIISVIIVLAIIVGITILVVKLIYSATKVWLSGELTIEDKTLATHILFILFYIGLFIGVFLLGKYIIEEFPVVVDIWGFIVVVIIFSVILFAIISWVIVRIGGEKFDKFIEKKEKTAFILTIIIFVLIPILVSIFLGFIYFQ